MGRAIPALMRRFKLFVGCVLVVLVSLPLLPGPGALVIAETTAVLEREFPWIRRLMDRLQALAAPGASHARRGPCDRTVIAPSTGRP